jgi:hypothetical protein
MLIGCILRSTASRLPLSIERLSRFRVPGSKFLVRGVQVRRSVFRVRVSETLLGNPEADCLEPEGDQSSNGRVGGRWRGRSVVVSDVVRFWTLTPSNPNGSCAVHSCAGEERHGPVRRAALRRVTAAPCGCG